MAKRARVAVTGLGATTALGSTLDGTFARLVSGERAFSEISEFDASCCKIRIAAEIKNFSTADVAPAGKAGLFSRADALAVSAAEQALRLAQIGERHLLLAVGGTSGGMREAEPIFVAGTSANLDAFTAQRLLTYPLYSTAKCLRGVFSSIQHSVTFCSACSSSATAIAQAASWIASGRCECALAGGTDSLSLLTLTGFAALGAMSAEPCRPFDEVRSGMSLGEGAAFLVLESEAHAAARGAEVLAWLDGWSLGAEAHHITHPEPSGSPSARLIARALRHAGIEPSAVGYYNAHGTGTVPNDAMEANAVRMAFGERAADVRVSTVKGQLGHTLGAAGAIEAAVTVLALRQGTLPATGGLENAAKDAPLNLVMGEAVRIHCEHAISGSFGFGGLGAVLAFSHVDTVSRIPGFTERRSVITGVFAPSLVAEPLSALDPERSRRFDRVTALASVGANQFNPSQTGLVVCNVYGNVDRLRTYLRRLGSKGLRGIAPAEFPHLVPSAIAGNTSIYCGLTGPTTNISDEVLGLESSLGFACDLLEHELSNSMIVGLVEANDTGARFIADPYELRSGPALKPRDTSVWLCVEDEKTAREAGKLPLARLVARSSGVGPWWHHLADQPVPVNVSRLRLVLVGIQTELVDTVAGLGAWAQAERVSFRGATEDSDGLSGLAIVSAVQSIANGEADEVVIVAKRADRISLLVLEKP